MKSASKRESRTPHPVTLPLLLEVGCEEIPARFLRDAEESLGERVQAALAEARLLPATDASAERGVGAVREPPLQTYSTPRRLVVHVPALSAQQPDKIEQILGPPVKVAIDAEGKYTRAAESFAQKNAARVDDLVRVTTAKGEYLALQKTTQGRPARELLAEILPSAILGLSFPKSMYWTAKSGPRFVRPIRWVLALLGEGKQAKTVEFEILGVKAGDFTFGHRAKSCKPQRVTGFKDYTKKLPLNQVVIDPAIRRERVQLECNRLLDEFQNRALGHPDLQGKDFCLSVVKDEGLEEWVVNSTEWPTAILGTFDILYQALPREILVTVMRDHQKYFAIENEHGVLESRFIAFLNRDGDPRGLIKQGHERVLRARFADALFFWNADQRAPLRDRAALLEKVTYQAKLGSYGDKVRRMKALAEHLCASLEARGILKAGQCGHVLRAVELCKCDLTTQMVQEFPELQGVVGGLYSVAQGEPPEVSGAIYDHYLPHGAEDRCPRSLVGAVVSLADKLDAVVGGFAVGLEPTGSSDPFALRRQANGTVKALLEFRLPLSLKRAVQQALNALNIVWRTSQLEVFQRVLEFFEERLRYYFEAVRSFRYDTVRAVLAAGWDVPVDAMARAEGLEAIRGGENLEPLAVAAKRIKNILTKSATAADWEPGEVDTKLWQERGEEELYRAYLKVAEEAATLGQAGEYRQALETIASLRPAVDRFFDKVLVMAEDRALRQNRLRLLGKLDELFSGIAQFAEIAGQ